ncbi:unnamed protein product [Blepharisma stoltei]|uniref:Uncharacterized protein n=1 Tax=Blepharisma stoltei TaxID=1481888 RepID=A0AAU9JWA3_9CILI|nr:unnamed protein product [Blepharisma stoltei]
MFTLVKNHIFRSSIYVFQTLRMESNVPGSITRRGNSIFLSVQAKPNARQSTITDINDQYIGVCVAAPPREGEANTELCEYLSQVIGVKKRQVSVKPGTQKSRSKIVEVETQLSPDQIYAVLRSASN